MKALLTLFVIIIAMLGLLTMCDLRNESNLPLNNIVKIEVICEDYYVYYSEDVQGEISWQGTGVFIEDDLILTAGHIVEGADQIWITWTDGRRHKAVSWYLETEADLGLIYIRTLEEEERLSFDAAILGEAVWASGNPFGVFPILSKGIVSAVDASDDYTHQKNMIVTDVAVNPGNSGCPLFDRDGNILGICSWGYNNSQGMNYFVDSDVCSATLDKYLAIKYLEGLE